MGYLKLGVLVNLPRRARRYIYMQRTVFSLYTDFTLPVWVSDQRVHSQSRPTTLILDIEERFPGPSLVFDPVQIGFSINIAAIHEKQKALLADGINLHECLISLLKT